MKKFLLTLIVTSLIQNLCFAEISFVYLNGSNSNTEKSKEWFIKGVNKLHPVIKKKFEINKEIKTVFPDKQHNKINAEPIIFFWGDKSRKELDFVQNQLDITKALSPTIAYEVRSLLASYLHDAIWVQKQHNMAPILDDLNETVIKESQKGNKVILFGYSAGTFVTYEYMFNKLPYVKLENLFNTIDVSENIRNFVRENPLPNTCVSALSKADVGYVSQNGHLIFRKDENLLKQNYKKLKDITSKACVPEGSLAGIVNFASPLVLFYSDIADSDYEPNYYNKLMIKYILENGMFFVTINYREDPLGFPSNRNLTIEEMENILDVDIDNPNGFIYDNSSVWSKRSFVFAHTSYWNTRKTFSKAVVKAFSNGYRLQYDKEFQQKVLKSRRKKIKFEMI